MHPTIDRSLRRVRALGVRLGLEDLVSASAGDDGLRELVALAAIGRGERVVELGCAGGRLLHHLRPVLPAAGARYTGVDRTGAGAGAARRTAWGLALSDSTRFLESDSLVILPLPTASHDVALVRGWLTRLASHDRRAVLQDLVRVLEPGGRLVVLEASAGYDAERVAGASARRDAELEHLGPVRARWDRLAGRRLLRGIERAFEGEVRRGVLQGFHPGALADELTAAGLAVDEVRALDDVGLVIARARRPSATGA